jgi:hypothetical protein
VRIIGSSRISGNNLWWQFCDPRRVLRTAHLARNPLCLRVS